MSFNDILKILDEIEDLSTDSSIQEQLISEIKKVALNYKTKIKSEETEKEKAKNHLKEQEIKLVIEKSSNKTSSISSVTQNYIYPYILDLDLSSIICNCILKHLDFLITSNSISLQEINEESYKVINKLISKDIIKELCERNCYFIECKSWIGVIEKRIINEKAWDDLRFAFIYVKDIEQSYYKLGDLNWNALYDFPQSKELIPEIEVESLDEQNKLPENKESQNSQSDVKLNSIKEGNDNKSKVNKPKSSFLF